MHEQGFQVRKLASELLPQRNEMRRYTMLMVVDFELWCIICKNINLIDLALDSNCAVECQSVSSVRNQFYFGYYLNLAIGMGKTITVF